MKTQFFILSVFCIGVLSIGYVDGQNELPLQPFSTLHLKGSATYVLIPSEQPNITADGVESISQICSITQKDGFLKLESTHTETSIILHYNNSLHTIIVSDAATVQMQGVYQGHKLHLLTEGASDVTAHFHVDTLFLQIRGASDVRCTGNCQHLDLKCGGASAIDLSGLTAETGYIRAQAASTVKASIIQQADIKASGTSSILLTRKPATLNIEKSHMADITIKNIMTDVSTTQTDSTMTEWNTDNHNEYEDRKREKFKATWTGLYLGFNTMVNRQFDLSMPSGYENLEFYYPRSIQVQLNFLEKSFSFYRNSVGLVTGLGIWFNNYRLERQNVILQKDSARLTLYTDTSKQYIKNKLATTQLIVPLLLEAQFQGNHSRHTLHFSLGVYGSLLLDARQKVVYAFNGNSVKEKFHRNYYLNFLRYGFMAQIGISRFSIYASYSPTLLWQKNKGPELYSFELGLKIL